MFWTNSIERKLADAFGFEYCTLFDTARSAMRAMGGMMYIPSNVCPIIGELFPEAKRLPVRPDTGLSAAPFQLYGYRQEFRYTFLEVDPLMTGHLREPCAKNVVISFGRKKMLDMGAGGALLSDEPFRGKSHFPEAYREELAWRFEAFRGYINRRWEKIDQWDRLLGDSCVRIPQEQVIPWRVIRRIPGKRDAVVKALREAGYAVGTNYPPLPGVTDAGAIQWGQEVINFFPGTQDIRGACEIIKRVVG